MKNLSSKYFVFGLGAAFIAIQLITGLNYPLFRDEYYYIACALRPDIGYVDHPPFSILILTVWMFIFGDSQLSIRIIPALLQVVLFIFTALIAEGLGGNKKAQVIAVLTAAFALPVFAAYSYYSMNSFDMVFWAVLFYLPIRILNSGNKKLWIIFGLIAGIGLMNKISIIFFLFGLGISLILTEHRKIYKDSYFWYGMMIAAAIFSPYIIWQFYNDFAAIEFIQNASRYKIASISQFDFIKEQFLSNNPINSAFWFTGLLALLFIKKYRRYRLIGLMYIVILIFFLINKSKPYYLYPVYPVLFAAGSIFVVNFFEKRNKQYIPWIAVSLVIITSLLLSPLVIPVLSPESYIRYSTALGLQASTGEKREEGLLPQFFADRFGWRELAQKVSDAYGSLNDEEKHNCVVYAENYGEAGALEYYSRQLPMPRVVSGHNNYWLWSSDMDTLHTVIIVGGNKEDHLKTLESVEEFSVHSERFAMPDENDLRIFIGRKLKVPFEAIKNEIKIFI